MQSLRYHSHLRYATWVVTREKHKRTSVRERRALQIEQIVTAAILEIDAVGVEEFRIKGLAARLDVFPAAIYWYLPNKEAILAEVVRRILSNVLPIDGSVFWRDRLRELYIRFRRAVAEHPNTAPLIGGNLLGNPAADLGFVEQVLSIVHEIGLRDRFLIAGYNTIIASLIGFVNEEFATTPRGHEVALKASVQERLRNIESDRYPIMHENIEILENRVFVLRWENGETMPMNETYSFYIDVISNGLLSLLDQQRLFGPPT